MVKSVCFVLMPFGRKPDASGRTIDFDRVHREIIAPAINDAGLFAVRADEEDTHGFIHKLMYERLLLSEYAIADMTILNANVYYELGIRHAARPSSTIMVMAEHSPLPFDVSGQRCLPYALDGAGAPMHVARDRAALADRLKASIARDLVDSPLYQLVDTLTPPTIAHERTDVFRERAVYSHEIKTRLAAARREKTADAVAAVAMSLGDPATMEAGVAIDTLLSYRAVNAHQHMVDLVERLDRTLASTTLVQEQLGFALNRLGRSDEAERVLKDVIARRGVSSESNGLLGRIYKDRWRAAEERGDAIAARGSLRKAIDTYLAGYHADIRDCYPGINALTLMEIAGDPRRHDLVPVVRYAIGLRTAGTAGDYWDNATRLELALIANDEPAALDAAGDAVNAATEDWQKQTTIGNLRNLAAARQKRGEDDGLIRTAIVALGG
jgi:tetratricopeptide (TPR) repeat protein